MVHILLIVFALLSFKFEGNIYISLAQNTPRDSFCFLGYTCLIGTLIENVYHGSAANYNQTQTNDTGES